ncbi:MAG: hypothetical protein WBG43_09945 [Marinifilaceae bacterium]
MKELDRAKVETIISKFPNLDDLLENEISKTTLGYKSIAVGTFDHWLSYEEGDKYLYMFDDQDDAMLVNRARTISSFPDIYLYDIDEETDSDILYKYDNKDELYHYVLEALRKQHILDFISYKPNMIISITPDLTDMYYTTDSDVCDLIIERAHEFNAKVFVSERE